ncbi:MAG: type II secretion system major pseudopilin GspG, partial [Pseudomonadota bacterium]
RIMSRPDEARLVKVQQDIRAISSALDLYRLDNFSYPTTDEGLEALVSRPDTLKPGARWKDGGYFDQLPKDPWGNDYVYLFPGQHSTYDLYSYGADGTAGGQGVSADVGNWNSQ